jgi:hypothetical protein
MMHANDLHMRYESSPFRYTSTDIIKESFQVCVASYFSTITVSGELYLMYAAVSGW